MAIYLKDVDVVPEVAKFQSALIVLCRFCPAASLAIQNDKPYIEFFRKCLYILLEGTVNLVIKNGGSITYNLSEPGDVFGWSSMLENGKYTASGICATDLKVAKIEKDKLNRIFQNRPEVGFKVLQRLAGVISRRLSNAYRDLLSARSTDTTPSYG